VAVIVGWAFGSEALTWEILISTVLILISVWLVLFRK
jgi:drug/metabolite transporter (DMT)-like permease